MTLSPSTTARSGTATGTARASGAVRVQHSLREQSERGPALALIVFLAVLPLEWITVTPAAGGFVKPFHLAALVFIVVCFARWRPSVVVMPAWHRHLGIYGAYAVVLGASIAGTIAHTDPYLSSTLIFRQSIYGATSLIIAGAMVMLAGRQAQRWLALSGVAAVAVLMMAFAYAMAIQGTNPLTILGRAISQADPDIITYELLRSTFRTDAALADVAASLRHKVFLGLLVALFFGLACSAMIERRHRLLHGLIRVVTALGFVFVLLSLSRSTILCLAVPFLLYPVRIFVRDRAKPKQAVALVVACASAVAVVISPIGELLFVRFAGSGSYTTRLTAAGPSFVAELQGSALVGAVRSSIERSPHNFVLNAWLGGGFVAGAAALVMLFALGWLWFREVRRFVTDAPGWVLPVQHIWVVGLGVIPIVRAFTSGNQFHMVDFTAIALFAGLTMANERAAATMARIAELNAVAESPQAGPAATRR